MYSFVYCIHTKQKVKKTEITRRKKMHPVQLPFHTVALEMTVLSMSCFLRVISPGILLFFT